MDRGFHFVTQHTVHHLMLLDTRFSVKRRADDHRFKVVAVTFALDRAVGKAGFDPALDIFGGYH